MFSYHSLCSVSSSCDSKKNRLFDADLVGSLGRGSAPGKWASLQMIEPLASVGVMTPPTSSMDLGFWDFFFFFLNFTKRNN